MQNSAQILKPTQNCMTKYWNKNL